MTTSNCVSNAGPALEIAFTGDFFFAFTVFSRATICSLGLICGGVPGFLGPASYLSLFFCLVYLKLDGRGTYLYPSGLSTFGRLLIGFRA